MTYDISVADSFEFGVLHANKIERDYHPDEPIEFVTRWTSEEGTRGCFVVHDEDGDWHYALSREEAETLNFVW